MPPVPMHPLAAPRPPSRPLSRLAGALLALAAPLAPAWAGDLAVQSTGAPVTVVRGEQIVGVTPLTLAALPEGPVDLGFRESALGATVFTQRVVVPATGVVTLSVDLPQRVAKLVEPPPPPAPAPPPPPAPPPAPAGDVYVGSTPAGATVYLDGKATELVTPAMVRGVTVGKHVVQVRTECARAQADVVVADGVIARAELALVTGKGALAVTGTPTGARVLVDGAEAGAVPVTLKDLACGDHDVAVRAPGYLEDARKVRLPAYETTSLTVALKKEEFGTLVVDVTPLDASLFVDTVDLGPGPRTVDRIAVGTHKVEGRLEGYTPVTQEVTIHPNAKSRVDLVLTPVTATAPLPVEPAPAKAPREPGPWARVALNSAVTAASVGAGVVAAVRYGVARDNYDTYALIEDEGEARAFYDAEVVAPRTQALGLGIGALAGLGGSAALWLTTDF